jgi:hypothetical protein
LRAGSNILYKTSEVNLWVYVITLIIYKTKVMY